MPRLSQIKDAIGRYKPTNNQKGLISMSNPRPESRIKSLESRATDIEASIEELSSDTAESLRAIRQDINALSDKVDQGFLQAHTYIDDHMADIKKDISELKDLLLQLINQQKS